MPDSMGDRMKDYENRTRYFLPRRCYTLIRIDGKAFHTYTKNLDRPFDDGLRTDMQETMKALCESIQGCKLGYTQSDEITLLLTDFDDIATDAWFDGNLQKMVSVSASMASAYFNLNRAKRYGAKFTPAIFDSRAWTVADPWEAYNAFLWRQQDCTRNAVQMVARSLASHKECQNKNSEALNELIFQRGKNFNDYPIDCRRGAYSYRTEGGWVIDKEPPILSQDKNYFFLKVPILQAPTFQE